MPYRRPRAFTLVELLVVIGVIAILISIILPTASKVRQRAQALVCTSNLRQLGVALTAYAEQTHYYPGCFLEMPNHDLFSIWPTRLRPFLAGNQAVFHCPSRDDRSIWKHDVPIDGQSRATEFYTGFGYEVGEPLLNGRGTPFSYGYNHGWADLQHGIRGLGSVNWDGFEFSITETKVSKVKLAADMIAIGDSESDGPMPTAISPLGGIWNGVESAFGSVGKVHFRGANILFCDGHVQWFFQPDVSMVGDGYPRSEDVYRRISVMWTSDHEP